MNSIQMYDLTVNDTFWKMPVGILYHPTDSHYQEECPFEAVGCWRQFIVSAVEKYTKLVEYKNIPCYTTL